MKLVDSSAWIEFLRRKGNLQVKQAVARLVNTDSAAYTCPTRFELLSGAKPEEESELEAVLSFCKHILFEAEDWRQAALLERRLRKSGLTVPRNDLFVATVGIRTGLVVSCRDTHFDVISAIVGSRLQVEQL